MDNIDLLTMLLAMLLLAWITREGIRENLKREKEFRKGLE